QVLSIDQIGTPQKAALLGIRARTSGSEEYQDEVNTHPVEVSPNGQHQRRRAAPSAACCCWTSVGSSSLGKRMTNRGPCECFLFFTTDGCRTIEQLMAVPAELRVISARNLHPLRVRWKQPSIRKHTLRRCDAVVRGVDLRDWNAKGR